MTAEQVDEIKKVWTIYNCKDWHGTHKETGLKLKAGTYIALLTKLQYSING